mmetsp:Transcript_5927/g.11695  ORF Transcript_5927/g.11695 Transcript_5927/m.11695 type:complete len:80 (-) Transcript_5927:18-257(-)
METVQEQIASKEKVHRSRNAWHGVRPIQFKIESQKLSSNHSGTSSPARKTAWVDATTPRQGQEIPGLSATLTLRRMKDP